MLCAEGGAAAAPAAPAADKGAKKEKPAKEEKKEKPAKEEKPAKGGKPSPEEIERLKAEKAKEKAAAKDKGGKKEEKAAAPAKEEKKDEKPAPSAKDIEKARQKIIKEGGKKGVEIEGASELGGLDFFCTTVELPEGKVDQLAMVAYVPDKEFNKSSDKVDT